MLLGANLPYLMGAYDHDLAPNPKKPDWGYSFTDWIGARYLASCKNMGLEAVRVWLCENAEGLLLNEAGMPVGVSPQLLRSVRALQGMAGLAGLRIYWSLFDGNAWQRNGDELGVRIFSDEGFAESTITHVLPELARVLDPRVSLALEILNEAESMSTEVVGTEGLSWETLAMGIRKLAGAWKNLCPRIPTTAGCQAVFLPGLWSDTAKHGKPPVDAVDLHVYHHEGGLPPREDLPVDIGRLPLLVGECGEREGNGQPGNDHLLHYFHNARKLGYEAVFFWKFEGPGMLAIRRDELLHEPLMFDPTNLGVKLRLLIERGLDSFKEA